MVDKWRLKIEQLISAARKPVGEVERVYPLGNGKLYFEVAEGAGILMARCSLRVGGSPSEHPKSPRNIN